MSPRKGWVGLTGYRCRCRQSGVIPLASLPAPPSLRRGQARAGLPSAEMPPPYESSERGKTEDGLIVLGERRKHSQERQPCSCYESPTSVVLASVLEDEPGASVLCVDVSSTTLKESKSRIMAISSLHHSPSLAQPNKKLGRARSVRYRSPNSGLFRRSSAAYDSTDGAEPLQCKLKQRLQPRARGKRVVKTQAGREPALVRRPDELEPSTQKMSEGASGLETAKRDSVWTSCTSVRYTVSGFV